VLCSIARGGKELSFAAIDRDFGAIDQSQRSPLIDATQVAACSFRSGWIGGVRALRQSDKDSAQLRL
jgi:hypothetical protein